LESSLKTPLSIRRFVIVFGLAFLMIAGAQVLRGRTHLAAVLHGLIWAAISACIFVVSQIHRERRKQRCAVCDVIDGSTSEGGPAV
jgi:hypothetical protein